MTRPLARLAAVFALAAITVSPCAAAKSKAFARPPYAGAYEPQGVDERGLWMQVDEAERSLRDSPSVLRDAGLAQFLRSVLCKTVGFDRCEAVRIYVIKEGSFNAAMWPNGMLFVHSGLLARTHSEAELAAVLGHEFAHFELRHGLQGFRNRRLTGDILSWLSLAGAATNQNVSASQNMLVANVFAFSRAQETEADLLSAAYVRGSPYSLRFAQIWQRLLEEDDALRVERGQRKVKRYRPGITETHPTNLQRIGYLSKLEAEGDDDGEEGGPSYRAATSPFLRDLFDGMIKGNEFAAADYVIRARGDAMGWDGPMLALRGELYRMRANPRDLVTARQFFEKATTYPDAPPESWRGLGLAALRLGEPQVGRAALAEYLRRQPDARDAATMKLMLEN